MNVNFNTYYKSGAVMDIKIEIPYSDLKCFKLPKSCGNCPVGYMECGCGRNVPFTSIDYEKRPESCKLHELSFDELVEILIKYLKEGDRNMDIQKALDIIEKWNFFYGQRVVRELWGDNPTDVQNQDIKDFNRDLGYIKQFMEELQQYRKVGTVERCMVAVKRITPLPAMISGGVYKCPSCGSGRSVKHRYNYCPKCGQAIDFVCKT